MGFLRIEQEVLISFNAAEEQAELYTADPVMIRKMDKLVEQNPEQFKEGRKEYYKGKVYSKRYIFPKRFIVIRSKDIEGGWSEERRKKQSERMKELRRSQNAINKAKNE